MPKVSQNTEVPRQEPIAGGELVMAITNFQRHQAKVSGEDYQRCQITICSGHDAGKRFYWNVSLDVSKPGAVGRLRALMESCGVTDEIEIGSSKESTAAEGDRNFRQYFVGRPFVGRLKTSKVDRFTRYDVDRIVYPSKWTDEQRQIMVAWRAEQERRDAERGAPPDDGWDDREPSDDDDPRGARESAHENPPARSLPDDDDIPF